MKAAILSALIGVALVLSGMHASGLALAQAQVLAQSTKPQRATPGLPQRVAPKSGVVLRTMCNGTCHCTKNCTNKWIGDNCKNSKADCSGDGSNEGTSCSCVNKNAAQ